MRRGIKRGFGIANTSHFFPCPVANDLPWKGQAQFVSKLRQVETVARDVAYRGWSGCRICGKTNGSHEYSYNGWEWPQGLMHYIVDHNVVPSEEFIKMISDAKL